MIKGILREFCSDSLLCSFSDLTSRISLLLSQVENFDADSLNTSLIIPPFLIQLLTPPFKYPITLSNPTLESLIIASFSLPLGATKINFLEISSNISPTQGANLPSSPIKIDPGM